MKILDSSVKIIEREHADAEVEFTLNFANNEKKESFSLEPNIE